MPRDIHDIYVEFYTFFVLLFTGFEQHFSIQFNDTFKRDFLYKIVLGFLYKID